jgi:cellulose biosynthesis protein BcsQ
VIREKGSVCWIWIFELRASVHHFNNGTKCCVNDYLNKACNVEKYLSDCTPPYVKSGRLFVGLADPSTEAIWEMSAKDRKWEMEALDRLLSLKEHLLKDMNFDYVICDSSPGLQYASINAIVTADVVLVVTFIDRSDVEGTHRMIHGIYNLYEKRLES